MLDLFRAFLALHSFFSSIVRRFMTKRGGSSLPKSSSATCSDSDDRTGKQAHDRRLAEDSKHRYSAQLRQALEFESLLKRITDKVRDSLDETQILQTTVEEVGLGLGVKRCQVVLYQLEQDTATLQYEYSESFLSLQGTVLPMSASPILYRQLLQGEHFQLGLVSPDPIQGRVTTLFCPIADEQGVLGDLRLVIDRDYVFGELELRLSQQITNQCATAIRQARLYRTSRSQVEELERLNRLKDDFLSTVSHELRSPMATMKMAIQMLEIMLPQAQMLPIHEKLGQYVYILQTECDREIELINDLLDLARLDATIQPLNQDPIALSHWIPAVAHSFELQIRAQGQVLIVDVPPNLPTIMTDESCLKRILTELLNNAYKYTPLGGTILVRVPTIGAMIHISVCNTGIMISDAELPYIFDKFYRIPNQNPWKHAGTGLGLALVKKLVQRLDGTIEVRSCTNQTQFILQFPLQGDEQATMEFPANSGT